MLLARLPTPSDFRLISAVCSHGFFALAPNHWDPARRELWTVITLDDRHAVAVSISQAGRARSPSSRSLQIDCDDELSSGHRAKVCAAVRRMLRLDEDLSGFHALCWSSASHRRAAETGFGRLLRSGSLFEDVVKVICTCNVTWRQTVAMVERITSTWGVGGTGGVSRGFPTPRRLAEVSIRQWRDTARVGYRAEYLHRLARGVTAGKLDLDRMDSFNGATDTLYGMLRELPGIGDYGSAHLCMLLGRYDRLAVDTELKRFVAQKCPRKRWTPALLRHCYDDWHPYQFLAYWYELWTGYTDRHGRPDQWSPETRRRITS